MRKIGIAIAIIAFFVFMLFYISWIDSRPVPPPFYCHVVLTLEEPPRKGDTLQVQEISNDTCYIGYSDIKFTVIDKIAKPTDTGYQWFIEVQKGTDTTTWKSIQVTKSIFDNTKQ